MNRISAIKAALAGAVLVAATMAGWAGEPTFSRIGFEDLMEGHPISIRESWNSVGIDPFDNVYAVFGGRTTEPHGEDCAVFQYNTLTGEKRLLGTFSDALKAADNYREDEHLPKGHSQLVYMNGKMYIGAQNFHDALGNPGDRRMIEAENARGAHLFAYDLETEKLEDLSADQPGGVFYPAAGFLNLAPVPDTDWLAVQTIPQGHIMLYNTVTGEVDRRVQGVESELGRFVGREIAPTPNGKIYFSYATGGETSLHNYDGNNHVYYYDIAADKRTDEPILVPDAANWNGQARSRDNTKIYVVPQNHGNVYRIDYENDQLINVGNILPEDERDPSVEDGFWYGAASVFGMVMADDEKSIYAVTVRRRRPDNPDQNAAGGRGGMRGMRGGGEGPASMPADGPRRGRGMMAADGQMPASMPADGPRRGRGMMMAQGEGPASMPAEGRRGGRGAGGPAVEPGMPGAGYSSGMVAYSLVQLDLETGETRRVARVPEGINAGYVLGSGLRDSDGSIFFEMHTMRYGAPFGLLRIDFEE